MQSKGHVNQGCFGQNNKLRMTTLQYFHTTTLPHTMQFDLYTLYMANVVLAPAIIDRRQRW